MIYVDNHPSKILAVNELFVLGEKQAGAQGAQGEAEGTSIRDSRSSTTTAFSS